MEELVLEARPREPGHANRSRRQGYVPAVVYGHGKPARSIEVEARELAVVLARGGRHHVIRLSGEPTIVQDVQYNPVSGELLHVDFHAVSLREKVHAEVPLRFRGEEKLTKVGALVQHQLRQVKVACRPTDLPDFIAVEIGGLEVGDVLTVADLKPPAGVELLEEPDEVVLTVLVPRAAVEEEPAEAAPAAAEPEVVKRGKSKEAEAEGSSD